MADIKILISNDDGIEAPGLLELERAMNDLGEVWVVAPDRERSAASHAISLHNPLRIKQHGERRYAVDGTPTDCVYVALHHLLDDAPNLVVSGINHGGNMGNDVLYSGTVAAAMEGALFGCNAIAVSLCMAEDARQRRIDGVPDFSAAASLALDLGRAACQNKMPPGVLLNVNVPVGTEQLPAHRGVKLTRLGYSDWAHSVDSRVDPRGRPYFWIGGERQRGDRVPESDNAAIAGGYASVTPVHYDLTDYRSFAYVRDLDTPKHQRIADRLGDEPLTHPVVRLKKRDDGAEQH